MRPQHAHPCFLSASTPDLVISKTRLHRPASYLNVSRDMAQRGYAVTRLCQKGNVQRKGHSCDKVHCIPPNLRHRERRTRPQATMPAANTTSCSSKTPVWTWVYCSGALRRHSGDRLRQAASWSAIALRLRRTQSVRSERAPPFSFVELAPYESECLTRAVGVRAALACPARCRSGSSWAVPNL